MKKNTLLLGFAALVLTFSACSSSSKLYRKGNYYQATIEAVKKLRSKPDHVKSQDILLKAYPLAQETALRTVSNAMLANSDTKYDAMVVQYERLNRLAQEIYACPKAYELIPAPREYIAELAEAKRLAAEELYTKGVKALAFGTLEQARIAYQYFVRANEYVNGYRDVWDKIEEARYYGTMKVLVEPPILPAKYQLSADYFYDNLIVQMNKDAEGKLLHFYRPEEKSHEQLRDVNHYLVLDFNDFTVGNIKETSNTTEVKRDSVVVGTVQVEGKTYNAYNTVKAQLTVYKREVISEGILSLRIVDPNTKQVIQQRNFAGQYVWVTSWAAFKGDDRALNAQQKRLCEQQAQFQPEAQVLFLEFTKPIYDQVLPFVRSIYSRY
ncbi:MAG: hypothetical protein LBS07_05325 [Prevotellaceae bacterium]|jgi:hypothetical protein|nr:hypothetical protein [Prevotellaceae bacterium]